MWAPSSVNSPSGCPTNLVARRTNVLIDADVRRMLGEES